MPRAQKVCSVPACPELTAKGRCVEHDREAEQRRGSSSERGYGQAHRAAFRKAVLTKHPICRCTGPCENHGAECWQPSKHADHYPRDKRELRRLGLNEHDPAYGRGLCASCHSVHTARTQPGGWNAR